MRILDKSWPANVVVLMTDSANHVSGKPGLTLTITLSKNGGSFAAITPVVTERGNGLYSLALTAAHTNTEGDLVLHITAGASADPTDVIMSVSVLQQLLRNKRVLDPTTGVETIYNNDSSTTLFTRTVYENAGGTQLYRDQGYDRVERFS